MTESKKEKWGRLMEKRLPKAQDSIRILGNLTSSNYEWSPETAEKVVRWLRDEIDQLEDKFKTAERRRGLTT